MNYIISIIPPYSHKKMQKICKELKLPVIISMPGKGTAEQSMLDLLGIEDNDKSIVLCVANGEKTKLFFKQIHSILNVGMPSQGISAAIPIKSVGGEKAVAYLNSNEENVKYSPQITAEHELIVAVANVGSTDDVMNAARKAGARGGTVIHGKGTGGTQTQKFYNLSIASEKEVILIISSAEKKADIMRSILEEAGPNTKSGALVFSLPTTQIAGFGLLEDDE